ncbi:MAG: peptide chain release factor N(5)-glutamine methyltransferase [Hyphomicrobiales bacterium]|nr:MAG: peptide chain release factor N(5)-glutamine methyltransferase [Hyphomicrobiales bacterium]
MVNRERDLAWPEALRKLQDMAARRLRGEPVVRILGEKEFYGLPFTLGGATLVPRPETEMLVARGLEILEGRQHKAILDLGTGTGCIAISILVESPPAHGVAVDLSPEALVTAQHNADRHGVDKRLSLRKGSWFSPLQAGEGFDLILSNPPYIASAEIDELAVEVKEHDPRLALDGGADGLEPYRIILAEVRKWLKPKGAVLVEIGSTQGFAVSALFYKAGLRDVVVHKDLAGLDRVVEGHHL